MSDLRELAEDLLSKVPGRVVYNNGRWEEYQRLTNPTAILALLDERDALVEVAEAARPMQTPTTDEEHTSERVWRLQEAFAALAKVRGGTS